MRRFGLLFAMLVLVGGAGDTPASSTIVAESGTLTLTAADARQLVDSATPEVRAQLQKDPTLLIRLVRGQMLQMALLQQARAKQWDKKPDVVFAAQQAYDAAIVNSYVASLSVPAAGYPSDADIQTAYQADKTHFMVPRQYHLAQIFVAVPQSASSQAEEDAQKKLHDIHQLLGKPRADFAAIARKQSEDQASVGKGGDLGWVREDQLAPSIKAAVAGLQDGAISDPIRAANGWHIVKLIATKPAAPAALDDVHDQLVAALRQQKTIQNERGIIDDMMRKQPIRLNEIELQKALQP